MLRTLTAVIAATALAGCGVHDGDNGATASKTYGVGNFSAIEVAGPYDVEVRTGSNASVSGQGSAKLLDHTVVEVQGDKLMIHPQESHSFFHWGWGHHRKAHFIVTVPQLAGATIAGSGDVSVDKVSGANFEGIVAGSGTLSVASMTVQQLKLSIAGSGGIKAGSGTAQSGKYDIAGSGDIDAGAIQAGGLDVTIAGSGGIKAHSNGAANVSVMGSGDVDIAGGAKCTISKAGSGSVHCS